jgi:hypothetical protein
LLQSYFSIKVAKSRAKIRNFNDGVQNILKILALDDIATLTNAVECVTAFADDCMLCNLPSAK